MILLSIHSVWKENLQAMAIEMNYGEALQLPGQFLDQQPAGALDDTADYVKELRHRFDTLRPVGGTRYGGQNPFVFKELATADQVFVRNDGLKKMLRSSYDGPFPVVSHDDKDFIV